MPQKWLFFLCILFLGLAVFTTGVVASATPEHLLVAYSGGLVQTSDCLEMKATAYTANAESTGKNPGHPAYGITFSGNRVEEGLTVAVDPEKIALGSWIYIEEMGIFRADDTGGKIKGDRIDIYMESVDDALEFGIRDVRVFVLKDNRV